MSPAPEPVKSPIWTPPGALVGFVMALMAVCALLAVVGTGLLVRLSQNGGCV